VRHGVNPHIIEEVSRYNAANATSPAEPTTQTTAADE